MSLSLLCAVSFSTIEARIIASSIRAYTVSPFALQAINYQLSQFEHFAFSSSNIEAFMPFGIIYVSGNRVPSSGDTARIFIK